MNDRRGQMEHIARIDRSLARGATRMALRSLAAENPDRRRELALFMERNPIRERRNEKARRRWLARLPRSGVLHLVTTADATRAAWIEGVTLLPEPGDPWSGVQFARVKIAIRRDGAPLDIKPICFVDQHVLMRVAQRGGDLNVAAYPRDIAEQTLGWIQAANEIGATAIAVPYRDGVIYGRRAFGTTLLSTYIGHAQLSVYRRKALEQLRADLPPLPRMPRLSLLPEEVCRRTAEAMARACRKLDEC